MAKWIKHGRRCTRATKFPGVAKVQGGGFLVRAQVIDPRTGRQREMRVSAHRDHQDRSIVITRIGAS